MNTEDKVLKMFHIVHPDFKDSSSCTLEVFEYNDWDEASGTHIYVMKGGNKCWGYSQEELLFEYLTRDWTEEVTLDE